MLGSHLRIFCTFVFLPSPNNIIFAKRGESTNEYKRNTNTCGKQHPRRYKRIQTEYKRVQTSKEHITFSNLALVEEDGGGRRRRRMGMGMEYGDGGG